MSNDVMKAAFRKAGLADQVRRVEEKERQEAAERELKRVSEEAERNKVSRSDYIYRAIADAMAKPNGSDEAIFVVNSLTVEDLNLDKTSQLFDLVLSSPFHAEVVSALYHRVISLSNMPPQIKSKVSRSFYSLNWEVDASGKPESDFLVILSLLKSVVVSINSFTYDKFFHIKKSVDTYGLLLLKYEFSGVRIKRFRESLVGELIRNSGGIVSNALESIGKAITNSIDSND